MKRMQTIEESSYRKVIRYTFSPTSVKHVKKNQSPQWQIIKICKY